MKREEFIEEWIKALESGEYKQGHGRLVTDRGDYKEYCCLGVACDVAKEKGIIKTRRTYQDRGYLTSKIAQFMGITQRGEFRKPIRVGNKFFYNLAQLNDNFVSFKRIAKIIRKQIDGGNL